MVKNCIACGAQMRDDANFCGKCGTKVIGEYPKNVHTVGIPIKQYPKNIHKKRPILNILLVIFIAGVLTIVVYGFLEINGFISPMTGISGTWEGKGTFTNNCDNPACRYVGTTNPPSIILQLQQNGNAVAGTITLNYPDSQVEELIGYPCFGYDNALSQIHNGLISSTHLTFTDDGGNEWALNVVGRGLQGFVRNNDIGCLGLQSSDISLFKK